MIDHRSARRARGRLSFFIVAGVLATLAPALPARGGASPGCGATLGPGGKITLDQDYLDCPGPALQIVGPVTILGAGHRIHCLNGSGATGIVVTGKAAKISNVVVEECSIAIELGGEGKHAVSRSLLHEAESNLVVVSSAGNRITGNVLKGSPDQLDDDISIDAGVSGTSISRNLFVGGGSDEDGIKDAGAGSKVTGNAFAFVGDSAYDHNSTGAGSKVKGNLVYGTGWQGIDLQGAGHSVLKNVIARTEGANISTEDGVTESKISGNVVFDAVGSNLEEPAVDCGTNTWSKNTFLTANQSCIH